MPNSIAIFTGKNLKMLQEDGGSGYWIAQSHRIKAAEYVVCIRNHRETWAVKDDGINHGQAFLIGKISGCISTTKYNGRKLIQISEYALLPTNDDSFKKAWKNLTDGQRYPVSYIETKDLLKKLNLDISSLDWHEFKADKSETEENISVNISAETDDSKDLTEIISEAKEMIAHAAGVGLDKVSIQIHF